MFGSMEIIMVKMENNNKIITNTIKRNKNSIILLSIFCLLLTFCTEKETNTWTVRINLAAGLGEADIEYTLITKEQYDRLLKQHTINNEYGRVYFTDVLEGNDGGKVIKGSPPKLNGYYYILMKTTAKDKELDKKLVYSGFGYSLQYGNSDIGWLTIVFWNNEATDDTYLLSSEDFTRTYNEYIGLVNGE